MGANQTAKNKQVFVCEESTDAKKLLKMRYHISHRLVGKGAFAKVYEGTSLSNPKLKVAIKAYKKKHLFEEDIKAIEAEVRVLSSLDHPNIVRYYEAIADAKNLYIVTEYIEGETLAKRLTKSKRPFREEDAAYVLHQLASAINHCHSNNVVHRDIKPDNIMIDGDLNVTLIDFGLSKVFSKKKLLKSKAGSPLFMAPEISNEKYSNKCDIWSFGVLMYIMLSGRLPFSGTTPAEVIKQAKQCELAFDSEFWTNTSQEAKDLMKKTININVKERYNCQQVLEHEWFDLLRDDTTDDSNANTEEQVLESLRNFNCESMFKKACLNLLARMVKLRPDVTIRQEFHRIDEKKNALISKDELKNAFDKINANIDDKEITQIIESVDFSGDNHISYTDFCVATMDSSELLTSTNIRTLFNQFDRNGDGEIDKQDILRELGCLNKKLPKSEIKNILKRYDAQKRGYITYQEFEDMIMNS